jgi:hypothetical protein
MEVKKEAAIAIIIVMLGVFIGMPFATIPPTDAASTLPQPPALQKGDIVVVHHTHGSMGIRWILDPFYAI